MNETLIGIVIGAFLTFLLSFLLERSKHNLLMKKHLYDIQREKLEDFYLLIENSIKFSTDVMTKMYILLHHGRENIDNNDYKRTADDFIKLTNTINMYFNDNEKLKALNNQANEAFKKGQEINAIILLEKNNDKKELNNQLVKAWKKFADILTEMKEEIPKSFFKLNN